MKKAVFSLALLLSVSLLATSCYTLTYSVGKGAPAGVETKAKNHYLIYGLAPLKTSDPVQMAAGATDYEVTISHTFVDGLLSAVTGGIYTPTTTKIKK